MNRAVHAEWTKQRTIAGTAWLLLGVAILTAALGAIAAGAVTYASAGSSPDLTKLSLTGVYLGQAVVAILAVQTISGEYSTGMIHLTLAAIPRRQTMLAAKAAVLAVLVLAAATCAVLISILLGRLILPGNGFTAAHGYQLLSLSHGPTLRAAIGSIIYLALVALLSLGVASAVRDSAVAIGIVLGLLYLFPIIAALVPDPNVRRHLEQIGPMTAGLTIQDTVNLHHLTIAPWAGLGVTAAWAGAAMLAGGLLLARRDA
jgi:ABC-2 type transport system permease protein